MDYIDEAVNSFRKLLEEQIARAEKISCTNTSAESNSKIKIGIIDGDGIGPIITGHATKVLNELLRNEIISGQIEIIEISGLTIENRMKLGKSVPDEILKRIKDCDVLLKGPTTTPKGGTMESANVTLRRELDLYANVRPVSIPNQNIDWTFFRENTEGEYVLGSRGVEIPRVLAVDFKVTTDAGTERIARAAFEFAKNNNKKRVSIITKANIMKKTDGKFSSICHRIASEYPEIEVDEYYIDIMTANLVNPAVRSNYQVFVLPNLYGDIITDEAAQLQGGVGTAGSANIGSKYAMFEAIHGSAPRMIEQGFAAWANPVSILRAAVMMLKHIGLYSAAEKLDKSLDICVRDYPIIKGGDITSAVFTEQLINYLKNV